MKGARVPQVQIDRFLYGTTLMLGVTVCFLVGWLFRVSNALREARGDIGWLEQQDYMRGAELNAAQEALDELEPLSAWVSPEGEDTLPLPGPLDLDQDWRELRDE